MRRRRKRGAWLALKAADLELAGRLLRARSWGRPATTRPSRPHQGYRYRDHPELHDFLLRQCREMQRAIREMAIRGRAALEDALDRAWNAAYRRQDLATRTSEPPSAWRKFMGVLADVAMILGVASGGVALPGEIMLAIEGPQSPAVVKVVEQEPPPTAPTAPAAHPNGAAAPGGAQSPATGSGTG